jgi:Kef-type K+ transport system membrane component KefB
MYCGGQQRPIANFLGNLGMLLLMFVAGLEIDLAQFRQTRARSLGFGLLTTTIPLLLGTMVALVFGYGPIAAIVVGSLLASHTLLGFPTVAEVGADRLEPVTVTVGATLLSDTLSLVVFAVCVSTYHSGFSVPGVSRQLIEIVVFVPLVLFASAVSAPTPSRRRRPRRTRTSC